VIDDKSAIVTERGKDPGIGTAPHCPIHGVLMFLKCSDYIICHGARWSLFLLLPLIWFNMSERFRGNGRQASEDNLAVRAGRQDQLVVEQVILD
jgi:hypothetical protein